MIYELKVLVMTDKGENEAIAGALQELAETVLQEGVPATPVTTEAGITLRASVARHEIH